MPNRRRSGYMPTRRHDTIKNPERARMKRRKESSHDEDERQSGASYEEWTKEELYARAKQLGVAGRSSMTKDQIINALRSRG